MKTNIARAAWIMLLSLAFQALLHAQQATGPDAAKEAATRPMSAEGKAISKQSDAYVAAYNAADTKTLAGLFTEKAEWVNEAGTTTSGRADIEKALTHSFTGMPGRSLSLTIDSVRPITADVVTVKGTNMITLADGTIQRNRYAVVYVKEPEDWRIAQMTESPSVRHETAEDHLKKLEWLIGNWEEEDGAIKVKTHVEWAESRAFLIRTFNVKRADTPELKGTEIIGWDPAHRTVRSWVFDSAGGFAEHVWSRDGDRWLIQATGTLPDGTQASAEHTLRFISADKYTWSSSNRTIAGELQPNIDQIDIIRVKAE
jgi:uncharacterized protein (TIGR02246 family)